MNCNIQISEHYADRFRKRIARTDRIEKFANEAYMHGESMDEVSDARLRKYLKNKDEEYSCTSIYRVYKGFIHVFNAFTATAITVYRVPNSYKF